MGIEIKDFNNPDDQNNNFNNATVDVVKVGDQRMMRITAAVSYTHLTLPTMDSV